MKEIAIGGIGYRIVAVERDGRWVAHARRVDNDDRFGVECGGATHPDALERLERWLTWQSKHSAALEALQTAERAYHRSVAGTAFASLGDGPAAAESRTASLGEMDAARNRLDEVRAGQPPCD